MNFDFVIRIRYLKINIVNAKIFYAVDILMQLIFLKLNSTITRRHNI
jgi:hypothetical protein